MSLTEQEWKKAKAIGLLGSAGIYLAGIGTAVYAGYQPWEISGIYIAGIVADNILGVLMTSSDLRTLTQVPFTLVAGMYMAKKKNDPNLTMPEKSIITQSNPTNIIPKPIEFDPWCELEEPEQKTNRSLGKSGE